MIFTITQRIQYKGLIWSSITCMTYRREEDVVAKEVVGVLLIIKVAKLS